MELLRNKTIPSGQREVTSKTARPHNTSDTKSTHDILDTQYYTMNSTHKKCTIFSIQAWGSKGRWL